MDKMLTTIHYKVQSHPLKISINKIPGPWLCPSFPSKIMFKEAKAEFHMGKLRTEKGLVIYQARSRSILRFACQRIRFSLRWLKKILKPSVVTSVFFLCVHGWFSAQGIKILLRCFRSVLKPGPDHQLAGPVELSIHASYGLAWPLRPVLVKNWSGPTRLRVEPLSTGHNCSLVVQTRPILEKYHFPYRQAVELNT